MPPGQGRFDYIVVGAGSSGAVLASRLTASGKFTVLLLEAGTAGSGYFWSRIPIGVYRMIEQPAVNWCFSSEPDEGSGGRRIEVPRGKMLGGSSSINGMVYMRGQAQDYDHWAQLGNRGWSWQDVLPLYKRLESYDGGSDDYRGRTGPLKVTNTPLRRMPLLDRMIEASAKVGMPFNADLNGSTQEGIGMSQVTIAGGRRQSTALCYLDPVRSRSNLTIETGAMAKTLIVRDKRCLGVRYSMGAERREALAAREVIICSGTINSPKLLELSGIGRADLLRSKGITPLHDLKGVGENLRDHYSPRLKFEITERGITLSDTARGWRLAREVIRYAISGEGILATTSVPLRAYFRTRPGLESPDATMAVLPFLFERIGKARRIARRRGITVNVNVLRPESTGSVHVKSADPAEAPAIRFNFLSARSDREGVVAAIRKGRELMATSPLKEITGDEIAPGRTVQGDDELLEWVRMNAETTYHPVGTCKMGTDSMAVVDPQLKVNGIEGLRVADASIMPTLTSGNTNAPCIMIGEKCADMVLMHAEKSAPWAAA